MQDLSAFITEHPWCAFGAWLVAFTLARSVGTIGGRWHARCLDKDDEDHYR